MEANKKDIRLEASHGNRMKETKNKTMEKRLTENKTCNDGVSEKHNGERRLERYEDRTLVIMIGKLRVNNVQKERKSNWRDKRVTT